MNHEESPTNYESDSFVIFIILFNVQLRSQKHGFHADPHKRNYCLSRSKTQIYINIFCRRKTETEADVGDDIFYFSEVKIEMWKTNDVRTC